MVLALPAVKPTATLLLPVVVSLNACVPTATLLFASEPLPPNIANLPTATLLSPSAMFPIAS